MDYTLKIVVLGALILGMMSGILGTFAVLRKQSLLGDMVSHAALPGIVIAFMISGSRNTLILLVGAAISGLLASFAVMKVIASSRIKSDSALGLSLSVFFGLGLMLLTKVQNSSGASQAGLNKFLFGQAAALLERDVLNLAVLGGVILLLVILLWRGFKILTFDLEFARSIGLPVFGLDILLTFLIVLSIILGLQLVGVILMSSMLIAPATAARQWTDQLEMMVILSALFGGFSGVVGAFVSSLTTKVPTGPVVVLASGVIVLISVLFAPNRGLVWGAFRRLFQHENIRREMVLQRLFVISNNHENPFHPHSPALIDLGFTAKKTIRKYFKELEKEGLISRTHKGDCALTNKGLEMAQRIHRGELQ
jgi:manganese/zinc/iron transport system permease protein